MSSVKSTGNGLADILEAIDQLVKAEVLVGIPEGENHKESSMTNAQIGYLQESGSPSQNIPPRPFLVPGIEQVQEQISMFLTKAIDSALNGNKQKMFNFLSRAGMTAQSSVRLYFVSGEFAPLSLATIRARANRGRTGAKKYLKQIKSGPPEAGLVNPLIDTGELRKSVTYVVKNGDKEVNHAES